MPVDPVRFENYGHHTLQPADILLDRPVIYRKIRGDESQDTILIDHYASDPFASNAPHMSDIEKALMPGFTAQRTDMREHLQERASEYYSAFEDRHHRTRQAAFVSVASLGASSLLSEAVVGSGLLGALSQGVTSQAFTSAALISGGSSLVDLAAARAITRQSIVDVRSGKRQLRAAADLYPGVAAADRDARSRYAPTMRRLLGEEGLTGYSAAVDDADRKMVPYLRRLADMDGHSHRGDGIPTFGFLSRRDFENCATRAGLTSAAKELLAPTVREYAHLSTAWNKAAEPPPPPPPPAMLIENGIARLNLGSDGGERRARLDQARRNGQRVFGVGDLQDDDDRDRDWHGTSQLVGHDRELSVPQSSSGSNATASARPAFQAFSGVGRRLGSGASGSSGVG